MSNNTQLNIHTTDGDTIATEEISGVKHELVKVEFGSDGVATKVSAANPMPVTDNAAELSLASLDLKDFATQATLAAVLAKISSDPATQTTLAAILAKIISSPATEATLAALSAKITNPLPVSGTVTVDTSTLATSAKQDTGNTSLASILAKIIAAPSTEAKQDTIITALATLLTISDFDTKTGSLTETAPATDTASSGLNGRLQRVAQRLTSLIALLPIALGTSGGLKVDGSGTALPVSGTVAVTGAGDASAANQTSQITQETAFNTVMGLVADAIVAAGATGSISAKLRRATQGLEDLKTLIVLAAGSAIIGKVGIDQTTPGTTNAVKATNFPTTIDTDSGNKSASTQRVVIATDQPQLTNKFLVTPDANSTIDLNKIAGNTPKVGSGNGSSTGSLNVYLATDQPALTNSQPVKSTQKPSIGATTVLAVTALQSLASSATVGWKSVRTSNLATLANDYEVMISLTTANTAPANDKAMYLFVIPWYTSDAGTTWFAASGGTTTLPTSADAGYTIASPHNFRLLGVLNYTTTLMVVQDTFLLSNCFGNRLPDGFSFCVINFSGAALSTSCILDITPINDILV